MNTNLELKALRRCVDEQRCIMDEYRETLKRCLDELDDLKLATVYSQQNKDKAHDGYKRELGRMQQLDRIRATLDRRVDTALVSPSQFVNSEHLGYQNLINNPFFNKNVTFN